MVTALPSSNQPISARCTALEEQETSFTFFAPGAKVVNLAGNFNSWDPNSTPLDNMGDGNWCVRVKLSAGQYEYLFVEDSRWSEDPSATQRVANSCGAFNSVLTVPLAVRTSPL